VFEVKDCVSALDSDFLQSLVLHIAQLVDGVYLFLCISALNFYFSSFRLDKFFNQGYYKYVEKQVAIKKQEGSVHLAFLDQPDIKYVSGRVDVAQQLLVRQQPQHPLERNVANSKLFRVFVPLDFAFVFLY